MNFLVGHECIFGEAACQFPHAIADVDESFPEIEVKRRVPYSEKRLFKDLGVWPSICILSFFTQNEIIETLRRVNHQAWQLCRRAYAPKQVALHKINLGTVKFFERAQEIVIKKESLAFFQ